MNTLQNHSRSCLEAKIKSKQYLASIIYENFQSSDMPHGEVSGHGP